MVPINALHVARDAAIQGGKILSYYWGRLKNVKRKTHASDLVTEADHESEEAILRVLKTSYPDHGVLAEESGLQKGASDYLWVVDPLDGTTNYTHQFPMVAVSIALLYQETPILGVVYNPIHDEMYMAAKGDGATLNGRSISVSKVDSLESSLLATGFPYDRKENLDNNYKEFCQMTDASQGVRRLGSAALDLAYVAAGRLDGYWEKGLGAWDIAAGALLVEEAGGLVTAYDLGPFDVQSGAILATNGSIQQLVSNSLIT